MSKNKNIVVVGGGLAGCEAAWQIANLGLEVHLYEMRPKVMTEAHKTDNLAFKTGYENRRINITMLFGNRVNN